MLGFRTALSWMTILPVQVPAELDRALGGRAVRSIPLVGALVGVVCGLVSWALASGGVPWPMSGVIITALLVFVTRGTHIAGLASTVEAVASRREPDTARQIMHSGRVGALGVAAIVLVLSAEIVGFGLLSAHQGHMMTGTAIAVSYWLTPLLCVAGASPLPRRGIGHLMVGTQVPAFGWAVATVGALLFTGAVAVTCALGGQLPDVPTVLALLYSGAAIAGTVFYQRYCVRRLGCLTGSVLAANVELLQACGVVAAVCALTALS